MSRSPPPPPLPYLPLDCVLEIASHVPIRTRAAMACVCRDWKAALDGPSFAWRTLDLPHLHLRGLWPLPPSLAARLPAVRALAVGADPFDRSFNEITWVFPSDLRPLLRAASGLTSLHVTAAPEEVALIAADAAAACPGLAALSVAVAVRYEHGRVLDGASLEPLTELTRLSRLRVVMERRAPAEALPRLPALRAVALELHPALVQRRGAPGPPEFHVSVWLANNATHLRSLDLHVQGNEVLDATPSSALPNVSPGAFTRLRVTGPDPSLGLAPWLAPMTRLVDLEWQCGPGVRWADTVDLRGRLEACAPRLTRLVLAGWPSHTIRFHQVPMPRLRVLQFRGFRPRFRRSLALPPITTAAPALQVLVIGLRYNMFAERGMVDAAPLLHRGLRELRTLVLEHASVTASKPAQPGDAARRAFPNLRTLHLHACVAADVRGEQVLAALRELADRTSTGGCPLETPEFGW